VPELLVVRHAHAGDRAPWPADDAERPLTRKGMAQAFALADLLAPFAPTRILSSRSRRCRQTVEPLAGRLGIAVEEDDRLYEGASGAEARAVAEEVQAGTAVLCSHGDVIPALLDRLAREGVQMDDPWAWAKGSTWIVEGDGTRFKRARYAPPGV
jgi:phosphohistidine phosphatase SixA